jgi:gamma-glutamyltranspeptidase/glutathione hydrolase
VIPGAAASTTGIATTAARDALASKGSAVDAVLAAFFAEAGANAEVLLAPLSALVVGTGAGERAFDGRAVQPGKGMDRPRGLLPGEAPQAVHQVAAPRTIAAIALMHASRGRLDMDKLAAYGVAAARDLGASRRAALIEDIGDAKATALGREPVVEALLAAGGKIAGGALSRADLAHASSDVPALVAQLVPSERARVIRVPWAFDEAIAQSAGTTEVIVAVDSWGLLAALTYQRAPSLEVPGLQIALPCIGAPVLRGVERMSPGTPLAAPVPIAVLDLGSQVTLALGAGTDGANGLTSLGDDALGPLSTAIPIDGAVKELARRTHDRLVCVALEAQKPRVVGHHVAS